MAVLLVLLKWALSLGPDGWGSWLGDSIYVLIFQTKNGLLTSSRRINHNLNQAADARGRKVMLSESRGSVPLRSLLLSGFSAV